MEGRELRSKMGSGGLRAAIEGGEWRVEGCGVARLPPLVSPPVLHRFIVLFIEVCSLALVVQGCVGWGACVDTKLGCVRGHETLIEGGG